MKELYKKSVKNDESIKDKKVRYFFCGQELRDEYKLGSIIKHNKINVSYGCVISVMLLNNSSMS